MLEKDVQKIKHASEAGLKKHYGFVARLRVLISNQEALGYLCVGILMSFLFGFSFVCMGLSDSINAGYIYSVSTYLWMLALSLDDAPRLVESYTNLKDIAKRVYVS